MLTTICADIKNYFLTNREQDIHPGQYKIEGGTISVPFLKAGQFFRIAGSALNDGVYRYPVENLQDEEWNGAIWAMSIPPAFLDLVDEIEDWIQKNGEAVSGPYTSESFAGYSYSKATSKTGTGGYSWQDQFATRLNPYRRLNVL